MGKKLKITDATKEELIEYFFGVEGLGGGFRIGADKDRFLLWLWRKRTDTLLDAGDTLAEATTKAMKQYINYVGQANDTADFNEKMKLFDKANKAYERYENLNKQYMATQKQIDEALEIE